MLNLLRGDYQKFSTIEQLKQIAVPKAEDFGGRSGKYWRGIQHGELMEAVFTVLEELGIVPYGEPTYTVSPNGAALCAGWELGEHPLGKNGRPRKVVEPLYCSGFDNDKAGGQGIVQSMGLVHSNDSRSSLKLAAGGRVLACSNGMVAGSQTCKRKHTHGLNLLEWLREQLAEFVEKLGMVGQMAQPLTDVKIATQKHINLMVDCARRDIIPWRLLGDMDRAWKKAEDGDVVWVDPEQANPEDWEFNASAWDWYSAATHVAKMLPPRQQILTLENLFNVCRDLLPQRLKKDDPEL